MKAKTPVLALAATVVVGCYSSIEDFADRLVTDSERAFAMDYLHLLRDGSVDSASSLLISDLQTAEAQEQLQLTAQALALADLDSLVLIGVDVNVGPGSRRDVNLSYEGRTEGGYLITNVATRESDGAVQVRGFSARPLAVSLSETHAFSLGGRSPIQFVWLVLLAVIPVFCIGTALLVARSRGMPRRWLWALVALITVPVFAMNWTTGAWEMRVLAMQFFGAGAVRGGSAAPWILSFGLPVGAFWALWKRGKWRTASSEPNPAEAAV